MGELNGIQKNMLKEIAGYESIPEGAYNLRSDGQLAGRRVTANIDIRTKEDKPGIDIIIKPNTKNERVDIPVILTQTGLNDLVYNDFYIGENADVLISILAVTLRPANCPSERRLYAPSGMDS